MIRYCTKAIHFREIFLCSCTLKIKNGGWVYIDWRKFGRCCYFQHVAHCFDRAPFLLFYSKKHPSNCPGRAYGVRKKSSQCISNAAQTLCLAFQTRLASVVVMYETLWRCNYLHHAVMSNAQRSSELATGCLRRQFGKKIDFLRVASCIC